MKTSSYTADTFLETRTLTSNDTIIHINGEIKTIYRNFPITIGKTAQGITKDEFDKNLSMNIGGSVYKRKNMLVKIKKEYSHDNIDYIVVNTYIPGMMYEENIILKKDYLKDFELAEVEQINTFK